MDFTHMVIICICSIVFYKYVATCENRVCLSWNVEGDKVNIVCNVTDMKYNIELIDPLNKTVGFCTSLSCGKRINITRTSNETILVYALNSDSRNVNGTWLCLHGRKRDNASVVVTAQEKPSLRSNASTTKTLGDNDNVPSPLECVYLETAFSTFGFAGVCLLAFITASVTKSCKLEIKLKKGRITSTVVLCFLFFLTPAVLGLTVKNCEAYGATAAWGGAIAISFILILTKDCLQGNGQHQQQEPNLEAVPMNSSAN